MDSVQRLAAAHRVAELDEQVQPGAGHLRRARQPGDARQAQVVDAGDDTVGRRRHVEDQRPRPR
ncbi:hypothetical protein, partial [Rubrivivax gelatinosus]|uniref:hypothetical protein n=1 Tax=Rubrivivax gelatinosus TaxID=28068 RepID=UPI0005C179E4